MAIPPKKKSFEEENARILGTTKNGDQDLEENDENESNVNPSVLLEFADKIKEGDEISVLGYEIKYGKTSPPKRYTSGSMILAMENAGQLIEDEELREQIHAPQRVSEVSDHHPAFLHGNAAVGAAVCLRNARRPQNDALPARRIRRDGDLDFVSAGSVHAGALHAAAVLPCAHSSDSRFLSAG